MHVAQVLPALENRDFLAITSEDVVTVAERINGAGFLRNRLRLLCVQLDQDAKKNDEFLQHHEQASTMDLALPRVQRAQVNYKGYGGNHCNTFFRMCRQGRPCKAFCSKETDAGWVLCVATLAESSEAWAECTKSAPWIVLSRDMLSQEPDAPAILQASENLVGECRVCPGYMDGLSRACRFLDSMGSQQACAALKKQMPNLARDAETLVYFCERMGGKGSALLSFWMFMSHHFVGKTRTLKTSLLDAICSLPLSVPQAKFCVAWAAQNCPDEKVDDDVCTWVTAAMVKALRGKPECKAVMQELNAGLQDCWTAVKATDPVAELRCYGALMARLGRVLLKLTHATFEDDPKDVQCCLTLYKEELAIIRNAAGVGGNAPPAASSVEKQRALKAKEMAARHVISYDAAGRVTDRAALLREAGVDIGVYVKGKALAKDFTGHPNADESLELDLRGEVQAFDDTCITVRLLGDAYSNVEYKIKYDNYEQYWSLELDREQIVDKGIVQNWQELQMHKQAAWKDHKAKSSVLTGLCMLAEVYGDSHKGNLLIQVKPAKSVRALAKFETGELVLVPTTTSLKVEAKSDKNMADNLETTVMGNEGCPVWICQPSMSFPAPGSGKRDKASLAAMWCVRKVKKADANEAEVNMEVKHVRVHGAVGLRWLGKDSTDAFRAY